MTHLPITPGQEILGGGSSHQNDPRPIGESQEHMLLAKNNAIVHASSVQAQLKSESWKSILVHQLIFLWSDVKASFLEPL